MNASERYIQQVLKRVLGSHEDRERLAEDLRSHFLDGQTRGETAAQIVARLGSPDDVAEAFHLERELRPAGFWQRVVAFCGDLGLLAVLVAPLIVGGIWLATELGSSAAWGRYLTLLVLLSTGMAVFGVFLCYFPLLEARYGKTLGKHLLGIRVVRETGIPISLGQAFLRRLSLYFEMLMPDALFIPFTPKKQRALDMLAKTVVVREPGREAGLGAWLACLALLGVSLAMLAWIAVACSAFQPGI